MANRIKNTPVREQARVRSRFRRPRSWSRCRVSGRKLPDPALSARAKSSFKLCRGTQSQLVSPKVGARRAKKVKAVKASLQHVPFTPGTPETNTTTGRTPLDRRTTHRSGDRVVPNEARIVRWSRPIVPPVTDLRRNRRQAIGKTRDVPPGPVRRVALARSEQCTPVPHRRTDQMNPFATPPSRSWAGRALWSGPNPSQRSAMSS